MRKQYIKPLFIIALIAISLFATTVLSFASDAREVTGKIYETEEKFDLANDNYIDSTTSNTYGKLLINGNIAMEQTDSGINHYTLSDGCASFTYTYYENNALSKDNWEIIKYTEKDISDISFSEKINRGGIIIQASHDSQSWVTVYEETDVFEKNPSATKELYTTEPIDTLNGCYYRIIVAYELERISGEGKFLFFTTEEKESIKRIELYNFYVVDETTASGTIDNAYKVSSSAKKVSGSKGYSNPQDLQIGDSQYGWELGEFYVTGQTATKKDGDTHIILKNPGDTPVLWFKLNYDINRLNDNEGLRIIADTSGYDQEFQTDYTNLGKGVLFIRYTNSKNHSTDIPAYTDYLNAAVTPTADIKVQLLEEGDYEIALDYVIQNDKIVLFGQSILPQSTCYRMNFKFSVRNGNCMVYPIDIKTGSELTNGSTAEEGFYIDLARSQYLDISVTKEVLTDNEDGLTQDTRFNYISQDGKCFTESGIYTITASNPYTNQKTEKKIYVGSDYFMKALVATGFSVEELKELLDNGAEILEDGSIIMPKENNNSQGDFINSSDNDASKNSLRMGTVAIIFIVFLIIVIIVICKNRKTKINHNITSNQFLEEDNEKKEK